MDDVVILQHLENLDHRLTRVEQILPTLATKDDLRGFATKDDLQQAIAPLATKDELRAEGERSRRHMDVLYEALRSDIQLLTEHLSVVMSKVFGE